MPKMLTMNGEFMNFPICISSIEAISKDKIDEDILLLPSDFLDHISMLQ
jgi:hypothetical protein